MSPLLDRIKSLWKSSESDSLTLGAITAAPDGTHEEIHSGRWPLKPSIPVETFPSALLLTEADVCLGARGAKEILLAVSEVGEHRVELLLVESDSKALGLGMRVPTARNQFKEPYILMEAEPGNTREDAVREVHFHLTGRLSEDEIRRTNWAGIFDSATRKLEALRGKAGPLDSPEA